MPAEWPLESAGGRLFPPAPVHGVRSLGYEVRIPLLIFGLLAVAIVGIGYWAYHDQNLILRQQEQANLAVIADSKVKQVADWLNERRHNAEVIACDPFFALEVERWFAAGMPANETADRIRQRLMSLQQDYDYAAVALLDPLGQSRLSVGGLQVESPDRRLISQVLQNGEIKVSDLYRQEAGPEPNIALDILAPLGRGGKGNPPVIGAVYFRIDPYRYLFPLIQGWPTPSRSAETLLVRRDDDHILYLNELRHRKETALRLRLPVSEERLPAAMAARKQEGVLEGLDYRQIPVLAAIRAVPATPWFMIAKIDRDEAYAPLRAIALLAVALVSLLIMAAGAGVGLWWRQQRAGWVADYYRAELERQALARRFDYLTRYANDIVLLTDDQGRLVEANDRAVATYGHSREELLRLNIQDLWMPETQGRFTEQMQRQGQADGFLFETVQRRKDGSRFPVEASCRLIDLEGKRYWQSIIRDISERKEVEEERRQSERWLTLFFDLPFIGMAITSATTKRWIRVNDRLCEIFGYAREELLRLTWAEITHPDDLAKDVAEFERVLRGDSEGYEMDKRFIRSDGQVIYATIDVKCIHRPDGAVDYFVATVQDITARKQAEASLQESERRYQALAHGSPVGMFKTDAHGDYVYVNERWCEITGLTANQAFGQGWVRAIDPADRERLFDVWYQAAEEQKPFQAEYRIRRADGAIIWVIGQVAAERDAHGEIVGYVGTTTDINKLKQTEQDLRLAREQLELRIAERTDLLRRVVTAQEEERRRVARELHDQMGQHLAALQLVLKSLEDKYADDPAASPRLTRMRAIAEEIDTEVDRLALELRPAALDDLGLEAVVLQHVSEWSERSGVPVDFHCHGFRHRRLPADIEIVLYRVVQEALTNVLKHAGATQVSLILEHRGDSVHMIIEDDGSGFDPQALERTGANKRRLGLLGMQERIELIGGAYEIESTAGTGTTIFLRVPLVEAAVEAGAHE